LAVYLSGHGYGHTVRSGQVMERLAERLPIQLQVVGAVPRRLWPQSLAHCTQWRGQACDVGVVQANEMSVDRGATIDLLGDWYGAYAEKVSAEAKWLAGGFDLVYGDVPPLAFSAARRAGVPSVALANFSWDWIYREMGLPEYADIAAEAYSSAALLLELEPSAPMPAFSSRLDLGLLGCRSKLGRAELGRQLGVDGDCSLVMVSLRSEANRRIGLPPRRDDVVYLADYPLAERDDARLVPASLSHRDVIAACDVVVTKPGYGVIGDCAANATRMLYAVPSGFPEHAVLCDWLRSREGNRMIDPAALADGAWAGDLQELLRLPAPAVVAADADNRAAARMETLLVDSRA